MKISYVILSCFLLATVAECASAPKQIERPPVIRAMPVAPAEVLEESNPWRRDTIGFNRIAEALRKLDGGGRLTALEQTAFLPTGALRPEVLATARASMFREDSDSRGAQELFAVLGGDFSRH